MEKSDLIWTMVLATRASAPLLFVAIASLFVIIKDETTKVRPGRPLEYSSLTWGSATHRVHTASSLVILSKPLLLQTLRGRTTYVQRQLYVPPSLDIDSQRALSLDLGNGNCFWTPPAVDVPSDIDFHKTVIAGFPSGDKRMIFIQMESLTGWRK